MKDNTFNTSIEKLRDEDLPSTSNSEQSLSTISQDGMFKTQHHADSKFFKMYNYFLQQKLIDVTLIAGDTKIGAHRIVLSSASDYFSAMFTSDLIESRSTEVELHSVCGSALNELVRYCYTGKVELREDSVETILSTASLLGLGQVVEACSNFLKKQLDPSNCIGIALFADSRSCTKLRDAAVAYIAEHFVDVLKSQEFLMLPFNEICKILSSDDLNIPSEETIFYGLMSWVQHDQENRKSDLVKLLEYVKLPLLPPAFLVDVVEPSIGPEGHSLVIEALKYHVLPERRACLRSFRTSPRKSTLGSLFVVGGMDANKGGATSIEVYNARTNQWSQVGSMAGRRLQFGVATLWRKLVVVGGRDGLKTLNSMESFDLDTQMWETLQPMATHRHGLGLAMLGDSGILYAVGGHDGWSYLNTVERWDPDTGQWNFVASMATPRSSVGLATLNNKLYAVGGRDGVTCLRTVEVYDPHKNKWSMCASMSKRRGGVAVAVFGGYLYAFGGHGMPTTNPSATRYDCVERYDPKTDSWTTVAPMSVGRDAIGVGILGDKIFAVGGYDGQSYHKLVEVYDPHLNTWDQVAPLDTGRCGSCVVSIPP
ncbi:kelch-like protein 5 isoform X2 [Cimex lectularius]|uniref:Kelch-like protein diablo n=1 Tax=Cimex lectularius TaxID=79782 RepID=A0A8I6TF07_CIMLE|nr:kelch-like protein 5 isoform X2 [Cimex lectularius]